MKSPNHLVIHHALERHWRSKYLKNVKVGSREIDGGQLFEIHSDMIKEGNHPRAYIHGKAVENVIILTHGLSDSPYYMDAVGRRFYDAGANVYITLLPGHGLIDPHEFIQDPELDGLWKEEMDGAVEIAQTMANRISMGGFSTGGALSYNKILRNPDLINGGLFLFAAAIDVRAIGILSQSLFIQAVAKGVDGKIMGLGKNPYKYPKLPKFAGLELGQIIDENETLRGGKKITQPVFAAHSVHDDTAMLSAVIDLIKNYAEVASLFVVAEDCEHASLTLDKDIELIESFEEGKPAPCNPQFEEMMAACISFFQKYIVTEG